MSVSPSVRLEPGARPRPEGRPARGQAALVFGVLVLIAACLYVAQAVFMPVALAVLLTFLLTPVVAFLQRHRVPRAVSVIVVVVLVFSVLAAIGWVLATQVATLGAELPKYKDNIRQKIADVRLLSRGGSLEKVQETVTEAAGEAERDVQREQARSKPAQPRQQKPMPVIVKQDDSTQIWNLPGTIGPWLEPAGIAGLVVVLVPFMLLARQELRNRVLGLLGLGRLALATKALDEASARVSRYLLTQGFINATFGALVAAGLSLLGVPYAMLWGFLAALLRFIPYVGPWLGALLPIMLAMAVFEGWTRPLMVVGLFLVLELFTNMVMETLLYARSAGVSEVALLVAVAFWTWLWGPIGLVLATPLTVCLVVFAKHIPEIEFLYILMGDEPIMAPHVTCYQRLLAGDLDEANDVIEEYVAANGREAAYDGVLIPALVLARRDRERRRLEAEDERRLLDAMREILDDLLETDAGTPGAREPEPASLRVLATPARDEADALALLMLRDLLRGSGVEVEVMPPDLLSSEVVARAGELPCQVVVIGALPPGGISRARQLCKRLRARLPELKLVVGRWAADGEDQAATLAVLQSAGADDVATTLLATRDVVRRYCPALPQPARAA